MKKAVLIFGILFLTLNYNVSATVEPYNENAFTTSAYRKYKDISSLPIKVPTVVEVPLYGEYIERFNFAVQDQTLGSFEPHYFNQKILKFDVPIGISTEVSAPGYMSDGNTSTYAEFPVSVDGQGFTKIILTSQEPVTSSAITALLDNYVALPNYIEVTAVVGGQEKVVLAKTGVNQNTIYFPKTTSNAWGISYWYSQPLRITELKLVQEDNAKNTLNSVRFLAQPGHSYRVYFDPDRYVSAPLGEWANLSIAKEVLVLSNILAQNNSEFIIADTDNDGVSDVTDNCISSFNPDQTDINNNNRGDICDDFDQDALINELDNCSNNPNFDQRDTDGDGVGDICDQEESRITEKYPWIPWVGIGFAAVVLVVLFMLTANSTSNKIENSNN